MIRLALLLPLALLSACAANAVGRTAPLAGTEWRMLAIDGRSAAAPAAARLSFASDSLSASAGCNRIGGSYHVERDRLVAGPLVQTEMYCEGPVWGQEQALSALLVAAPEIRFGGETLTLVSGGHKAEFRRTAG